MVSVVKLNTGELLIVKLSVTTLSQPTELLNVCVAVVLLDV